MQPAQHYYTRVGGGLASVKLSGNFHVRTNIKADEQIISGQYPFAAYNTCSH